MPTDPVVDNTGDAAESVVIELDPAARRLATVKAGLCTALHRILAGLEADHFWAGHLRSIGQDMADLSAAMLRFADEPNLPVTEDDLVLTVPSSDPTAPEVGSGGMVICWPGPKATAGVIFGNQPGDEHLMMVLDPLNLALTTPPERGDWPAMTRFLRELARSAIQMANRIVAIGQAPVPEDSAGSGGVR